MKRKRETSRNKSIFETHIDLRRRFGIGFCFQVARKENERMKRKRKRFIARHGDTERNDE